MSTRFRRQPLLAAFAAAVIFSAGGTAAAISTGTVAAAFAQDQPGGAPPAAAHGRRMGQLLMSLGLSDQQKSQIRAIIADAHKQNANVTDPDTRHANMRAAYKKVDAVLTPAQRTELQAKRDAMRQANPDARAQ